MIVGITHDEQGHVIQRLSVSTKVAIGLPPSGSRNYPIKVDHFVFLRKPPDAKKGTAWEIDPDLSKHYGESCRELEIILLDDDLENVFPNRMAWWLTSTCKCHGDGEKAIRRTEAHPEGESWSPCATGGCKDLAEGRCKPSADLRFMLADFPRLGSVARIHTSSYRSIQQIHSSLQQIQIITGGRLAGITAKLMVRPEKTSYEDKGERKSTTIYALSLEMKADGVKKLVEKMTETARLFEQTRKALGTGHIEVMDEEEPEMGEEIQPEFYPERQAPEPEAAAAPAGNGKEPLPAQPAPAPAQIHVAKPDVITDEERRNLFKLAQQAEVSFDDLKAYLREMHGVESTAKLSREIAVDAVSWLESVKEGSKK